ncbi:MAG TPA: lipid-binding SYLF domain-containing protein [Candidatus Nitrosopolaris sp.]|nr:lipid-binding SYLF domain-containing protein [Candidatus Nitrosopolaris sp.]
MNHGSHSIRTLTLACIALTAVVGSSIPRPASAASAAELNRDSAAALNQLYAQQPSARVLGQKAKGILVFPAMVKAGFMFGGQVGEGALRKNGKVVAYYNSVAASYGFQAGVQKFGYALFFMTNAALDQLDSTDGFELGVGPSLVVVDEGMGKSITTNTITSDVYAFIFSQKGLMAGAGIQGSKITRISK